MALTPAGATASGAAADQTGLEAAIVAGRAALARILKGDPGGFQALWAERDDVTLGNPFGPYVKGHAAVRAAVAGAAAKYRDGDIIGVEDIARYVSGNLACIVEVQHSRARLGASTVHETFALRVTNLFERTAAGWKLVHRHADPITTPRTADSVLPR